MAIIVWINRLSQDLVYAVLVMMMWPVSGETRPINDTLEIFNVRIGIVLDAHRPIL